ncbi:MAG: hypothetical protein M3R03_05400 [Pseudomonadota bacterium]|nr:hypothetical protein [Pseudomonadota bacterium]
MTTLISTSLVPKPIVCGGDFVIFSLALGLIDVGARSNSPHDAAVLRADGARAPDHPAILDVVTVQSILHFKLIAVGKTVRPLVSHGGLVVV